MSHMDLNNTVAKAIPIGVRKDCPSSSVALRGVGFFRRSACKEPPEAPELQSESPNRTAQWWWSGQVGRVRFIGPLVPATGQASLVVRSGPVTSRSSCPVVWRSLGHPFPGRIRGCRHRKRTPLKELPGANTVG